jgi:hypothetical protein
MSSEQFFSNIQDENMFTDRPMGKKNKKNKMPQDSKQGNNFLEMNHSETRIDCGGHTFGQAVSEKIYKNRPIRNKNCLWRSCLSIDRDKMSNL